MMLFDLLGFLVFFGVMSIVIHEWAHTQQFAAYGIKVKTHWKNGAFVVGEDKDYEGLSNKQLRRIYLVGIVGGALCIIAGAIFFSGIYILLLFPYLLWCKSDIKNLIRYWKD